VTTESKKHYPIRRPKKDGAKTTATSNERRYGAAKKPDELEEHAPRRERRALSHVGGEIRFRGGTEEERAVLLSALDVSAEEEEVMSDVHGFHSYPARLHPLTARRLIEGFSSVGARVMDPFCGSGTVVLEAKALGREAIGSDLNPLAVELSWLKSRSPMPKLVTEMLEAAAGIAEVAEERRTKKAEPYQRYGQDERERYPIHILLELDSLSHGINLVPGNEAKRMLRLVISSMLTKLSHSEGDTTRRHAPRRLPSGFAIQLFHQKAEELAGRLRAYRERVAPKAPKAYVGMNDARDLKNIESDTIDLIITSPPYPGVYDYLDHHFHRMQWLGLRPTRLEEDEIGARRKYRRLGLDEAAAEWREEIGPTLYELRRTLADDGRGIMIVADSVVDRKPLYADEQIELVAERAGIDITCIASQERPLFLHGAERAFSDRPRMEHVVIFRPKLRKKGTKEKKLDIARPEERVRPARFRKHDEARMLKEDAERERKEQRPRSTGGPGASSRGTPGRGAPGRGAPGRRTFRTGESPKKK
jgi:hypothetical protein